MKKSKKIIFISDDMAYTLDANSAISELINLGILDGATVLANGNAFDNAIEVSKSTNEFILGVHLNIIEGKSLTNCPFLTDSEGNFNKSYLSLILNSFNKDFLQQIESEFRAQIEKTIENFGRIGLIPTRLDSHVHVHAIPNIFKIVLKLAQEYKIPYVRMQNEHIYSTLDKFPKMINIIKILLLKFFTFINRFFVKKYNINFNDYIVGVGYTGEMTSDVIKEGIKKAPFGVVEILIHPEKNSSNQIRNNEYLEAKDGSLLEFLNFYR